MICPFSAKSYNILAYEGPQGSLNLLRFVSDDHSENAWAACLPLPSGCREPTPTLWQRKERGKDECSKITKARSAFWERMDPRQLGNHRLEGTLKITELQPPSIDWLPPSRPSCPGFLGSSRDGAPTAFGSFYVNEAKFMGGMATSGVLLRTESMVGPVGAEHPTLS